MFLHYLGLVVLGLVLWRLFCWLGKRATVKINQIALTSWVPSGLKARKYVYEGLSVASLIGSGISIICYSITIIIK